MVSIEAFYVDTHRIIIAISYIVVFVSGLYISQSFPYIYIFQSYDKNYFTFKSNVSNISASVSDELLFLKIGTAYRTDKVTIHHYEKMYEKYLRKYVGSNVSLLEIGLGCGQSYGAGASAYLWRIYLGPKANLHFIEYDQKCGEEWYKLHGHKVNDYKIYK